MTKPEKTAAKALGWNESAWDEGDTAAFDTAWARLSSKQREAAVVLGFNAREWDDAGDSGSDSDDVSTQMSQTTASTVDDYDTPDGRIVSACARGNLKQAMQEYEAILDAKDSPRAKSVGALISAHCTTDSLPVAFKLFQSTQKLPESSLPPRAAILDFLEQCERDKIDKKALKRVQALLKKLHKRGYNVDKTIQAAYKHAVKPRKEIPSRSDSDSDSDSSGSTMSTGSRSSRSSGSSGSSGWSSTVSSTSTHSGHSGRPRKRRGSDTDYSSSYSGS